MKNRIITFLAIATMALSLVACASNQQAVETTDSAEEVVAENVTPIEDEADTSDDSQVQETSLDLEDGTYIVDFTTDSSMFHVNESMNGKGTLTVENHVGTLHITLASKNIVNLYAGLASDAESDEDNWLMPTVDTVTYEDGTSEEVYGFDVPLTVLDEEFDLALLGTKGTWYDHKVQVSNPELSSEEE
ncbi:MAG: hypothetical protein K6F66_01105 [Pseudobutyrivibrio sp.]|nr:hypothetical protein [Pseudobutyrivibrio sp.]